WRSCCYDGSIEGQGRRRRHSERGTVSSEQKMTRGVRGAHNPFANRLSAANDAAARRRRDGGAVERAGLENRKPERVRGFESDSLLPLAGVHSPSLTSAPD